MGSTRPATLLRDAERLLEHARSATQSGRPVWGWFAAHQSAETALHALTRDSVNGTHRLLTPLLIDAATTLAVPDELMQRADVLDSHYIPIRLHDLPMDVVRPNGAPPTEFAIQFAEDILRLVRTHLRDGR